MDIRKIVARHLKHFRNAAGYSQEGLALKVGIHRTYVSGVERGIRNPSVQILEKIAKPLGISAWELLYDGKK